MLQFGDRYEGIFDKCAPCVLYMGLSALCYFILHAFNLALARPLLQAPVKSRRLVMASSVLMCVRLVSKLTWVPTMPNVVDKHRPREHDYARSRDVTHVKP